MVKLLLKLALFFGLLILIKVPFFLTFEDELSLRWEGFEEQKYNTVFIGSSRTQDGILPSYFDELNRNLTHSYNFGSTAGVSYQTLDRCEEIIEHKAGIKFIFFELSGGIDNIQIYREPWRTFNWQEHWRMTQKLSWQKSLVYNERLLITIFKPNIFPGKIDDKQSLEEAMERVVETEENVNTRRLGVLRLRNLQVEKNINGAIAVNEHYWERITRLIEQAEAKGIKIYFYVPPRLRTDDELQIVHPIWQKLDDKYKMPVEHFDPSLYRIELSKDEGHLNHGGARIFTKMMAQTFAQKHR